MPSPLAAGINDYDAQREDIARRQKYAQLLQQQSMDFTPQPTQVVGGWAIPNGKGGMLQALAQVLKGYTANNMLEKATQEQKDLSGQRSAALAQAMQAMPQAQQQTTVQPTSQEGTGSFDMSGTAGPATQTQTVSPTMQQNAAWLASLNPLGKDAQGMGTTMLGMQQKHDENRLAQEARTQDKMLALDAASSNLALSLADRKAAREQSEQLRRDMAQQSDQTKRDLADQALQGRKDMLGIAASLRAPHPEPAVTPVDIVDPQTGRVNKVDARTGRVLGLSTADTKQQGALNQDTASLGSSTNSMDRLATAANEALTHPGLAGTTGLRGAIPNIPGSAAADAAAKLGTLKSQVAFGVLQEMRNNSKTGGALGAVSDKEGALLQANLAALDKAQSVDQMKESLKKIIDYANGAKDRLRNAYNLKHGDREGQTQPPAGYGGPERRAAPASNPVVDDLLKKYGG